MYQLTELAGETLGIMIDIALATAGLNKDLKKASLARLIKNVDCLSKEGSFITIDEYATVWFLEVVLLQAQ